MEIYDLGIAWDWPYDADFVALLEAACHKRGLTVLQVTQDNLSAVTEALAQERLSFSAFFDRAWDANPAFYPLAQEVERRVPRLINPYSQARWVHDKATMHLEFLARGIAVPYTLTVAPVEEPWGPSPSAMAPLGPSFVLKPALGGGGEGVVADVQTWQQVLAEQQRLGYDKWLLQEQVRPAILEDRPAWFRVICAAQGIFPCWWHPATHRYEVLTATDEARLELGQLRDIASAIAALAGLDLFSTEIAWTQAGQFLAVDYVNDPCDMRLQSRAADGVPDEIVVAVARQLAELVERRQPT
ncbi:MAG: hypothetical protein WBW48_23650 [Anaerolineae bacterium]